MHSEPQAQKGKTDELWRQLVAAENAFFAARMALFQSGADIPGLVVRALDDPSGRGTALRLLPLLDEDARRQVFPQLVELASWGHGYTRDIRDIILSLDRSWVLTHVPPEVDRVLQQSPTYEEYRRLAELLRMLESPYLSSLVHAAAASDDPDIREVANDFETSDPSTEP